MPKKETVIWEDLRPDSVENRFKLWLLDKCADLDNSKLTFQKFLRLLEEGSKKCYKILYGEK